MTLTQFEKLITTLKHIDTRNDALYVHGINVFAYSDIYNIAITLLGESVFTPDGWELIEEYMYPSVQEDASPGNTNSRKFEKVGDLYAYLMECGYVN